MKNFSFLLTALVAVFSMFFVSCSQSDDLSTDSAAEQQNGVYTYTLHMDGGAPNFEGGVTSRAVSTSWASGSTVYLRFLKSGTSSTYITGTATYNGSSWTFSTTTELTATSANTSCTAVYVENPKSSTSSTITLSPTSCAYKGTGTYTCTSSDIYVNVTVEPLTARLRFKGTSGTSITLPGSQNNLKYIPSISLSTLNASTATTSDVSLTVGSTGYTDYIYCTPTNISGNNTLYVTNSTDGNSYQMTTFSGSKLATGTSGYLTVPTTSNYNSLGWTKVTATDPDKNAYVKPNVIAPFTDGFAHDYTMGSTANTFYMTMFKSLSSYSSDEEIIAAILDGNTAKNVSDYKTSVSLWSEDSWFTANTTYYLCIIAYNSNGVRGPLQKIEIKTNATTLPQAVISNLTSSTYNSSNVWKWNVALKNNATKYYMYSSENASIVSTDEHFCAYDLYSDIKSGTTTTTYDYTDPYISRSASQFAVITYAVNSSGALGNYSYAKYPTSSYAKSKTSTVSKSSPMLKKETDRAQKNPIISLTRPAQYNFSQYKIR